MIVTNCSFKKVVKHHGVSFLEKKQKNLVINESNKHLFPHSDPESGDKDILEKIYVDQCFETYKEMSREELIDMGMIPEEEA